MDITITVEMYDELNEKNVSRTIDGSNALVSNTNAPLNYEHQILGTTRQIEDNLNKWIDTRANQQHDTFLTLVSWKINK